MSNGYDEKWQTWRCIIYAEQPRKGSSMEINRKHPEYGVWHLEPNTPVNYIPRGAILVWREGICQFGFHLCNGEIACRDGILQASTLARKTPCSEMNGYCVIAKNAVPVIFEEETVRAELIAAGKYIHICDFLSASIGDTDLADIANFPVWVFEKCGRVAWYPIAENAGFEKIDVKTTDAKQV